jgi:hypothetical protein
MSEEEKKNDRPEKRPERSTLPSHLTEVGFGMSSFQDGISAFEQKGMTSQSKPVDKPKPPPEPKDAADSAKPKE